MLRKFLLLCAVVGLILSGVTVHYATTGPAIPADAAPSFELAAIRAQVSGAGPASVSVEETGTGQMLEFVLFAGGGLHGHPIALHAVELRWADRTVLIDPGTNLACSQLYSPGLVVHADAFARMEAAMARADAIIATHEHYDHICAISTYRDLDDILPAVQLTAAQLRSDVLANGFWGVGGATLRERATPLSYTGSHEVAPGVVLIEAPGHTPGSQWIYIQRADGAELLLVGDTAWSGRYIRESIYKPWLTMAVIGEDASQQVRHIRFLRDLQRAHPELTILVAHDHKQWAAAVSAGLVTRGF